MRLLGFRALNPRAVLYFQGVVGSVSPLCSQCRGGLWVAQFCFFGGHRIGRGMVLARGRSGSSISNPGRNPESWFVYNTLWVRCFEKNFSRSVAGQLRCPALGSLRFAFGAACLRIALTGSVPALLPVNPRRGSFPFNEWRVRFRILMFHRPGPRLKISSGDARAAQ